MEINFAPIVGDMEQISSPGSMWSEVVEQTTPDWRLTEIAKDPGAGLLVLDKLLERKPELAEQVKQNELIKTLATQPNFWSRTTGRASYKDFYRNLYTKLGYAQMYEEQHEIDMRNKKAAIAAGILLGGTELDKPSPKTTLPKQNSKTAKQINR